MIDKIKDTTAAVSAFLVIGIFGGVERGSMEGWQLIHALILISVINIAMNAIVRVRKGYGNGHKNRNDGRRIH